MAAIWIASATSAGSPVFYVGVRHILQGVRDDEDLLELWRRLVDPTRKQVTPAAPRPSGQDHTLRIGSASELTDLLSLHSQHVERTLRQRYTLKFFSRKFDPEYCEGNKKAVVGLLQQALKRKVMLDVPGPIACKTVVSRFQHVFPLETRITIILRTAKDLETLIKKHASEVERVLLGLYSRTTFLHRFNPARCSETTRDALIDLLQQVLGTKVVVSFPSQAACERLFVKFERILR